MLQAERGDGHHRHAGLADQERVLVGPVVRAAVLEHPEPPGGGLLAHAVVEHDHAVRHVLLDAVARQRPGAALARDDRRDAAVLEPPEEAAELRTHRCAVGEGREEVLDRVDHHALGADRLDGGCEADEQALQIPGARLHDLARFDAHVLEREPAVGLEPAEVEPERRDVGDQVLSRLLERHEHSGLAVVGDAADQELDPQERLAAACRTTYERRATAWQAASGHLVKARYSGGRLG